MHVPRALPSESGFNASSLIPSLNVSSFGGKLKKSSPLFNKRQPCRHRLVPVDRSNHWSWLSSSSIEIFRSSISKRSEFLTIASSSGRDELSSEPAHLAIQGQAMSEQIMQGRGREDEEAVAYPQPHGSLAPRRSGRMQQPDPPGLLLDAPQPPAILAEAPPQPPAPPAAGRGTPGTELPPPDPPGVPPTAPVYPMTLQAMMERKDHPLRMKLEWDEMQRAVSIKKAIHRTAGLDDISDFWCVQYALICKDNERCVRMEDVIERAEALQVFRNQYDVAESYQEGCRALRKFVTLCPNFILAFMYNPSKGNYTLVKNLANMSAENFSPRDKRDFMVGFYYLVLSSVPDFHSINKGPNILIECIGMGWSKRHNMKLLHASSSECLSHIPHDICHAMLYNTGVGGAIFKMLLKPIIEIVTESLGGEEWHAKRKLEDGLTYLEGLDSVFLFPDATTCQERALRAMEESLRLRFENQRRFSLKEEHWDDICPSAHEDMLEAINDARWG